jgi:hypothetical protein
MGTLQQQTNRQLVLQVTSNHYRWLIMPVHLNRNHWVSLIADVRNKIGGIVDSMLLSGNGRFHSTNHFIKKFIVFMIERAILTNELDVTWTETRYLADQQQDGSSLRCFVAHKCGGIVNDISIDDVDTSCAKFYRPYILERLVLHSRVYNTNTDKACEMLDCAEPYNR